MFGKKSYSEIENNNNQNKNINKEGMAKFLVTIGTYFLIIAFIVIFVILKFGLSYNITKVMPNFRTTLYSESNFYQYDIPTLEKAKTQLTSHYNKVKNEVYNEKDYYEEGQRGMLKYNLDHITSAIDKLNIATFSEAYATLSEADYYPYITDPIFKYDKTNHRNNLYVTCDFFNAIDKGLYYEVPCEFHEPFLLNKASVSELPLNATMSIIEFNPYMEEGIMVTPYVKRDSALLEYPSAFQDEEGNVQVVSIPVILQDYNDEYYVGMEGNQVKMGMGPFANLRILKGTDVTYTTSFLFTSALKTIDDKWGNRNNPYFPIEEVIDVALNEEKMDEKDIAMNTLVTNPYFNYITYDEKGYVTDLAFIGENPSK